MFFHKRIIPHLFNFSESEVLQSKGLGYICYSVLVLFNIVGLTRFTFVVCSFNVNFSCLSIFSFCWLGLFSFCNLLSFSNLFSFYNLLLRSLFIIFHFLSIVWWIKLIGNSFCKLFPLLWWIINHIFRRIFDSTIKSRIIVHQIIIYLFHLSVTFWHIIYMRKILIIIERGSNNSLCELFLNSLIVFRL